MEGKRVYFQAFGSLWYAKGYYRVRGNYLVLQVVKAVPSIDIARGHVKGKRVAKGLPPMQIRIPEGAGLLETLQNELDGYSVVTSYHPLGSVTPLRY